jgi:hypothetical protein
MPHKASVLIRISEQKLYLLDELEEVIQQYLVSTSKYGVGSEESSYKTPLGKHCISDKIGETASRREVFIGREAKGVLEELLEQNIKLPEDIITSRILWLGGLESGVNRGGNIDTHQRYIYIHGTPEEDKIGIPVSHGCIRMRNDDVIDLFDQVEEGCEVIIEE